MGVSVSQCFGVVLVWLSFVRGFLSSIFHKCPFVEWVGRGGLFFFGLFWWLVWSLGGGKGRGLFFEKVAQGAVTSSRFAKIFFQFRMGKERWGWANCKWGDNR